MADITTPILLLTLLLVLYAPNLSHRAQVVYLLFLIFSIRAHSSHLLILLGTLTVLMLGYLLRCILKREKIKFTASLILRVRLITIAIILCMLSGLLLNTLNGLIMLKRGGDFSLISRGGSIFLLARLMDTPIVEDFLEKHCSEDSSYRLCAYRQHLAKSSGEFLWTEAGKENSHLGILENVGSWTRMKTESARMLRAIFSEGKYITMFTQDALYGTVRQFFTTSLGDNIFINTYTAHYITTKFPFWEKYFFEKGKAHLTTTLEWVAQLDNIQAYALPLSVILSIILMLWTPLRATMLPPLLIIFVFLWVNAGVVATFSGIAPRYQARIIWVLPFWVLLCIARTVTIYIALYYQQHNAKQ